MLAYPVKLLPVVARRRSLPAGALHVGHNARRFVSDNTRRAGSYDEFKQIMTEKRGFIVTGWCRKADCEARIKEETRATVRVIPIDGPSTPGACVRCGEPSAGEVYFAQAY